MICLFDNKAEKLDLIETNGDFILDPICTDAIITEELNGEYSLDADFIIDKKSHIDYDMICEDSLIKIDDEYGKEYFRIAKVTKTIRKITIFARHITISDILTMFCEDVRPENQNGAGAISWIFDNASGKKWFNVSSDIPTLSTAYYVNKNVYEALFTADNSFLDRWGGETYRRGFNIAINQRVGADRGVQIRSKKNLTGFEASTNINSLMTRIYPKGYNGITIDEKYIDSKYINNYSSIFAKEVKFEGVKVIEEGKNEEGYTNLVDAQNELKRLVNDLYEVDKVDLITATYRINFVQLEKTEEYKNYSILERTWLGDTIEVIEDTLGINITVRVLKRKYDVIKGKRIETELSNKDTKEKPPTIQQVINKIEKLPTAENVIQIAKEQATAVINAGINGYVVANKNEILIMDTPDKNTAIKVWRFNVNGIGYSNTGYYGEYGTAITMEGQIVADFISVGILNAGLIKAGVLSSFNNTTWINMENGTFNFANKIKFENDVFSIDANAVFNAVNDEAGNGNKITFSATGNRSIQMWADIGDVFTIKVPFYNENSGFRLCTDTGVNLITAAAKTGEVYRMTLCGFQTDNIKSTYMVLSKDFLKYDDNGNYFKPVYARNENAGISRIGKLGIVNKSSGGLYMQVDLEDGLAYGIDIWSSDVKLKKNIKELVTTENGIMTFESEKLKGLELIKQMKHYEFDFDETKGMKGHVDCGYISQQLQELNSNLVLEVEQENGENIIEPISSSIIPHLSLAIQEQNNIIESLKDEIENLKKLIGGV